jgi:hypothetical protein
MGLGIKGLSSLPRPYSFFAACLIHCLAYLAAA